MYCYIHQPHDLYNRMRGKRKNLTVYTKKKPLQTEPFVKIIPENTKNIVRIKFLAYF